MGFAGASCSFTRYALSERPPADLWPRIPALLRRFAFRDIDDLPEERSFGWTSFDDMLDTEWNAAPPEKGAYLAFVLRLETRRIPPSVLKKHFALALREEKTRAKERGKSYIGRERKKELREMVQQRLMKRFLPVPALFDVLWNTADNTVWFASTRGKVLDMFEDLFTQTFELALDRLTPYGLAASQLDEARLLRLDRLEPADFAPPAGGPE
jgi:hypothetical protein